MKKTTYSQLKEPTSEEKFIMDYFEKIGLLFDREVRLEVLTGDDKHYRDIDFYLIDYDIYVEYFGMYNSTKRIREEYDKKADILIKNSVPTIFLYPHELGIIEYAFHKKMVRLFKVKKFGFGRKLFMYRLKRYIRETTKGNLKTLIVSFAVLYVFLFHQTGFSKDLEGDIILFSFLSFVYGFIGWMIDIRRYFYLDR